MTDTERLEWIFRQNFLALERRQQGWLSHGAPLYLSREQLDLALQKEPMPWGGATDRKEQWPPLN